jgi:hypothetical protein
MAFLRAFQQVIMDTGLVVADPVLPQGMPGIL